MSGGKIDILVEPDTRGFGSKLESGLKSTSGVAGKVGKGIALALAAGTAVAGFGLSAVISKGIEYQANLNELQAVSQATALDMRKVGDTAKALGADMSLPATSAADAAAAMVELAKGGLTVDEAMKAAKGTLQLAAAAQVDGAQAAEIQANSLNAFGLEADQAGRVADVLANTANAAAGSIVDIGNSMKFIAPVSAALKISIEDTAAAIGLLANQGIKGEQAGTSLRGILASLASPSAAAKKGLRALNVEVFDAQGKFVGLRKFTDQLAQAKKRLSDAEFAAAASTAFGNEGFTAANALAAEGAVAFDQMVVSVSRVGGAADVAAARTKGLGGAIEGFKSQVETAGIGIFEAISPPLEAATRSAASFVEKATPAVVKGIKNMVDAGRLFGPSLADAIRDRGAVVGSAVRDVLGPIAGTVPGLLNAGLNVAIGLWNDFTDVLADVVDAARPVARGIADVAKAAVEADGPLSAVGAALGLAGDVAKIAASALVPIGKIVGGIVSAFADLPGPVQTAVIALGLMAAFRGPLSSLGDTIGSRVTAPFKAMGEEIRLQQALLTGSTDIMSAQVGKVGLAMAALESRSPAIQAMRTSFDNASAGAERFSRTAGFAAAAGTGLKNAASGIVGALGGPWGVAIAGASVGLSLLAGANQRAAQQEADHKQQVDLLADALRESNGIVTEYVRSLAIKRLEESGAAQTARDLGIPLSQLTDAYLGNKVALDQINTAIGTNIAQVEQQGQAEGQVAGQNPLADKYAELKDQLAGLGGEFAAAEEKNRRFDEAVRNGDVSMLDATATGRDLSKAMGVLRDNTAGADDKARALKDALDALSGDQITLEAAQARLNEQLAQLRDLFGENVDKAKGWGAALLNVDGSINTSLPNGKRLFDLTRDIGGGMAEVAQSTFDASRQLGDSVPVAMEKARASAQATREEFLKQADAAGIGAIEAGKLADKYKLVPELVTTLIQTPGMTQAQLELILVRELVNKIPPGKDIPVRSLSDEAKKKLQELGFIVTTLPNGEVLVRANTTAAQDALNDFINRNRNKVIGVTVETKFAPGSGGHAFVAAQGAVVKAYAGGGVERKLTPMRAGIAQIVPPNTWRVVGDRVRDDEFFIPDNKSARSLALAQEFARRQGMQLVRLFANGAVASQSSRDILASADRPPVVIEHLEVRPLAGRFSLSEIQNELYFQGVR